MLEPQRNADSPIPVYFSAGFGYVFNRHWSVQFNNAASLQDRLTLSNFRQLTVSYHLLLKKSGNPLVAKPGLGYYWRRDLRNMGTLDNRSREVSLGGSKAFRTDEVNLYFGPRSRGVVASLKLGQKLREDKWLYLEAGASRQTSRRMGYAAAEASGFFLFRRSREGFIADEPALQFDGQTPVMKQKVRFYAEVGLRLCLF